MRKPRPPTAPHPLPSPDPQPLAQTTPPRTRASPSSSHGTPPTSRAASSCRVSSECVSYTRSSAPRCRPAGEPPQQPLGFGSEESSRSGFGSQALGYREHIVPETCQHFESSYGRCSLFPSAPEASSKDVAGQRTSGRRRLSLIRALRSCDCNEFLCLVFTEFCRLELGVAVLVGAVPDTPRPPLRRHVCSMHTTVGG